MYFVVKKAAKATFRTDIYEEPVKKKLLNVDKNDYQESYFDHFFCVFLATLNIFLSVGSKGGKMSSNLRELL